MHRLPPKIPGCLAAALALDDTAKYAFFLQQRREIRATRVLVAGVMIFLAFAARILRRHANRSSVPRSSDRTASRRARRRVAPPSANSATPQHAAAHDAERMIGRSPSGAGRAGRFYQADKSGRGISAAVDPLLRRRHSTYGPLRKA
jgi:hypothetical protein